jgi:hypothetical protein
LQASHNTNNQAIQEPNMIRHASRRQQKYDRSKRSHIFEILERRALLCDVSAALNNGVLEVAGGLTDDSIALVYNHEQRTIEVHGTEHSVASFSASDVRSLHIEGLDGNDQISIDPTLELPTTIDGGAGTDTVIGLTGVDRLFGTGETLDDRSERSVCLGVECFQDASGTVTLTISTPEEKQDDLVPATGVLSSVHEHPHVISDTAILSNVASPQAANGISHASHLAITPAVLSDLGSSLLSHHNSEGVSSEIGAASEDVHEATHNPATGGAINDYTGAEHAMSGMSEEAHVAAASAEFATKSPYKTECPTSSPVGAPAVASSSSPTAVGGEIANTVSGAPKIGCKCMAMQRAAQQKEQARLSSDSAIYVSVPAADTSAEESKPSCCQQAEHDADQLMQIEWIDTTPTETEQQQPVDQPAADSTLDQSTSSERTESQGESMTTWQRSIVATGLALGGIALHFQNRKRTQVYAAEQN